MLRTDPKAPCAGMTLYQVLHELQTVLALILGACPLCCQPLTPGRLPPPSPEPNKVRRVARVSWQRRAACTEFEQQLFGQVVAAADAPRRI